MNLVKRPLERSVEVWCGVWALYIAQISGRSRVFQEATSKGYRKEARHRRVCEDSVTTTPSDTKLRFIGRQAILDETISLYGYELLFRSGTDNAFSGNAEEATNQVIDSCLSMIACSTAKNLFINCTRDALVNRSLELLPSRTVVLEILETVTVDAELVRACKRLKLSGFRLALDDFSPNESMRELVEIADFIKIDFRASDPAVRREIYGMCRNRKTIFLAEKIETPAQLQIAQAEGSTLFQGYFHSRPEIICEAQMSINKSTYLQLFATLAKPSLDLREIERLILLEPSLCYRLLRLANSASRGSRYRISTIQAALNLVGEDAFRKLVTVILAGKLSRSATDRNVEQSLERAHFCESLALVLNENPSELYMLGMLSMMDRMLNIPMMQLVSLVSLNSRIQEALLGSSKGIGRALELCKCHEHGGAVEGLIHNDPLVSESASNYFNALLSAGSTLHELIL
jgi:c-di-GMP phosphodiesterase